MKKLTLLVLFLLPPAIQGEERPEMVDLFFSVQKTIIEQIRNKSDLTLDPYTYRHEPRPSFSTEFCMHDEIGIKTILDEKNGFLQIVDACGSALHDAFVIRMGLFNDSAGNHSLLMVTVTIHSSAYGNNYFLFPFRINGTELHLTAPSRYFPAVKPRLFFDTPSAAKVIERLTTVFNDTPLYLYRVPRYGTTVTVRTDAHNFIRCDETATSPEDSCDHINRMNRLQIRYRQLRKYELILKWDSEKKRFIYEGRRQYPYRDCQTPSRLCLSLDATL